MNNRLSIQACGWAVLLILSVGPARTDAQQPARDADDATSISLNIVTLGDSITKGVRPGVTADQTFAARLETALGQAGSRATVINVGIGGERTDQALQRIDGVIDAYRPTIVTIMYGTNDSYVDQGAKASRIGVDEYRQNLLQLVARVRAAEVIPVLMTEPRWASNAGPNGVGEHPNVRLERYMEVCREVAKQQQVPLVDHFAHWTKSESEGIDLAEWTTDACHPNPRGHAELAQLILPAVEKAAAQSKSGIE